LFTQIYVTLQFFFVPVSKEEAAKAKTSAKDAEQPPAEAAEGEELGAAGGTPQDNLSPKTRPRSKSDRFARPTRKQVVDVYKQVFCFVVFDFGRKEKTTFLILSESLNTRYKNSIFFPFPC
jgi:hypothetical protein